MKKPIRVRILDDEYLLRSDEDEERVLEIARYLNEKLEEIRAGVAEMPEAKIALLAAFHIASDYFEVLHSRNTLLNQVQDRVRSLIGQIESVTDQD